MKNFLKENLLAQVFIALIVGWFLASYLPLKAVCFFYSLSCSLKDILMFFLPFIVFSYLVSSIISYSQDAPKFILFVFAAVIASIAVSLIYSYGVGTYILPKIVLLDTVTKIELHETISALWTLPLYHISTDSVMMVSLMIGLWLSFLNSTKAQMLRQNFYNKRNGHPLGFIEWIVSHIVSFGLFASNANLQKVHALISGCKAWSEAFLVRVFVPCVPLYVFGFIMKFSVECDVSVLKEFWQIFLCNLGAIVMFILLAYIAANYGHFKQTWLSVKNMLPATLTGLSTMSSCATMPVTLQCLGKNLPDTTAAKFIVPSTVNVHAIGDVINIAVFGLAFVWMQTHAFPTFIQYLPFVFYTCIAQFSCVSVPGGGIIVMVGILQKYLGLSADSTSLLISIYFLLEPFLTCCNVTYTGAFTMGLSRLFNKGLSQNRIH